MDGSSPRVRGISFGTRICCAVIRIIPACAGNISALPVTVQITGDHPRVCGEYTKELTATQLTVGSSPRVRGICHCCLAICRSDRIIPACAGNMRRPHEYTVIRGDHPRVCGEYKIEAFLNIPVTGSSPRVRGIYDLDLFFECVTGIIPACAGNISYARDIYRVSKDHPRVCGEYSLPLAGPKYTPGSSPRVRGISQGAITQWASGRIIPACAGNIAHIWFLSIRNEDHPRVCGEYAPIAPWIAPLVGSSPRVRGI